MRALHHSHRLDLIFLYVVCQAALEVPGSLISTTVTRRAFCSSKRPIASPLSSPSRPSWDSHFEKDIVGRGANGLQRS